MKYPAGSRLRIMNTDQLLRGFKDKLKALPLEDEAFYELLDEYSHVADLERLLDYSSLPLSSLWHLVQLSDLLLEETPLHQVQEMGRRAYLALEYALPANMPPEKHFQIVHDVTLEYEDKLSRLCLNSPEIRGVFAGSVSSLGLIVDFRLFSDRSLKMIVWAADQEIASFQSSADDPDGFSCMFITCVKKDVQAVLSSRGVDDALSPLSDLQKHNEDLGDSTLTTATAGNRNNPASSFFRRTAKFLKKFSDSFSMTEEERLAAGIVLESDFKKHSAGKSASDVEPDDE